MINFRDMLLVLMAFEQQDKNNCLRKIRSLLRNKISLCGTTAQPRGAQGQRKSSLGNDLRTGHVMTYILRLRRAENGGVSGIHFRHRERQVSFI